MLPLRIRFLLHSGGMSFFFNLDMARFTELLNCSNSSPLKVSSIVLLFFLKPRLGFKKATGTAAAKVPIRAISQTPALKRALSYIIDLF